MEVSEVLQSDATQKVLIALLSAAVGIIAAVAVQRVKSRDERREAERLRRADRENPHLNVRRSSVLGDQDGYLTQTVTWKVHPSWIDMDGERGPCIRGWEHLRLVQEVYRSLEKGGPIQNCLDGLKDWSMDDAVRRHDWLVFREYKGDELHFTHTEPCAPEDSHLFAFAKPTSADIIRRSE